MTDHVHDRARGERHGQAKMTFERVTSLRLNRIGGMSVRSLSKRYGISRRQVNRIIKWENWR